MNRIYWSEISDGHQGLHLARVQLHAGRVSHSHDHDFYECFLVTGGEGIHQINGVCHPLASSVFWTICPEDRHVFEVPSPAGLSFLNIAFRADLIRDQCKGVRGLWHIRGPVCLPPEACGSIAGYFDDVFSGTRTDLDGSYLATAIARACRVEDSAGGEVMPQRLAEALLVAGRSEHLRGGVTKLQQLCGYTPEHLSRVFRKHFGITPSEWITRRRIEHAKRLLGGTAKSVLEVALECGYESPSHFHRQFRQRVGTTPLKYRRGSVVV